MRSDARKRTTPEPTPLTDTEREGAGWDALNETTAWRCCDCRSCNHYLDDYDPTLTCEVVAAIDLIIAARTEAAVAASLAPIEARIEAAITTTGATDAGDPVRAGLLEGYRDSLRIVRAALAGGGDRVPRLTNACAGCGDCYHPAIGPNTDGEACQWCRDCGCHADEHTRMTGAAGGGDRG